jgi:hypothetical protein
MIRATALPLWPAVLLAGVAAITQTDPPFVESAADAGLTFTHVNGAAGRYYMPEIMGAGAALFDHDNDGDLDVFLVQGGPLGDAAPESPAPTSRLFRNDLATAADGRRTLKFTDVTDRAGLAVRLYGMGAAVGDYDNDGDLDLFLTSFGPDVLYRNNGDGTFTDVTKEAGVSDPLWSSSAAFVDHDRDGDLDLFVANYLDFSIADNRRCHDSLGARDYCSPRAYRPVADRFYRNEGNGRFVDATVAAGIAKADGACLRVSTGDYDGDGWIDLYVANDATPNQLWINNRDGTFRDEGLLSGTAVNAAGNPEGSMGVASGDPDADGDEDLFITNIVAETFVLYENDGKATFDDARVRWGVSAPTAPFTGFGTDWIDYDNDGWLDLFIANGAVNVIEAQRGTPAPFRMRNQLLRNVGSKRFVDVTADAGAAFARAEIGRGAAFGDIDNDGDVDIVVTTNGGPVRLLINQARPHGSHHWLRVKLEQEGGNRYAFGARVGVERAGQPTLWRRIRTDGSYLSANDVRAHFGLGRSERVDAVVIEWPDGTRERRTDVGVDREIRILRGRQ